MPQENHVQVYTINRDIDEERWASVQMCSAPGVKINRVAAFDGYSEGFDENEAFASVFETRKHRTRLGGRPACFLSHAACWKLVANGSEEFAIITEDDIQVLPLAASLAGTDVPDIGFANPRMIRQRNISFKNDDRPWISVGETMEKISLDLDSGSFELTRKIKSGKLSEPGGDAYIITRKGANALLDAVLQSDFSPTVDYFLYFVSSGRAVFEKIIERGMRLPSGYSEYFHVPDVKVNGAVYIEPLVERTHRLASNSTRVTKKNPSTATRL